jgi:hypothetical protein
MAIIILCAIVVVMIVFYVINFFNSSLSTDSDDWGSFGSYIGCITSLLAFVGVLYSIEVSSQHYEKDSEQNKFFNLLNLHKDKMYNVEYVSMSDKSISMKGPDAFKMYTDLANKALKILVLTELFNEKILNKPFNNPKILEDLYEESHELFDIIIKVGFLINYDQGIEYCNPNYDLFKELQKDIININGGRKSISDIKEIDGIRLLERNNLETVFNELKPWEEQIISKRISEMEYSKLISMVIKASDCIYKKYGHITGHYFRNMYYIMDTIQGFTTKDNYNMMYRAQLSRYELALGLYNAMSSQSSLQMIELLKCFNIFKDITKDDVIFINVLCQKMNKTQQKMETTELLDKTEKILQQNGSII